MAAARGMEIPPPDQIPPELEYTLPKASDTKEMADATNIQHLTVPITSRSQSLNSDSSTPAQPVPTASPVASGTSTSPLFRTRAKTLAALTTSKYGSQTDLTPRELRLPKDPFVNGQPIEVYLYKEASECPICFLYYPPYLNRTRCCDQPICSECFVQIKRPDPHPPEHGEPDSNAPPRPEGEPAESTEGQLVSEPSACPFCVQPEFGVTYAPPPFRRGLTYAADLSARPSPKIISPVSSTSSLSSTNLAPVSGRRRATSLSASDPSVVTTDRVRPDWAQKLANARAHAARRSAAATALHTAAYLMNSGQSGGESRGLGLGRRGLRRATQGDASRSGSPAINPLAFLTDRSDRTPPRIAGPDIDSAEEGPGSIAPPRDSSRRSRIDDLEEMMMMEAIRLSLASEEERRRMEEKEARKEAKKREKEAKKAEKVARKTGLYSNNASTSALATRSEATLGKVGNSSSSVGEETSTSGKGKGVDRTTSTTAADPVQPSSPTSADAVDPLVVNSAATEQVSVTESSRPSHLRHMSSASSSISSIMEAGADERPGFNATVDGSSTNLEPMFNFRSLAAVIGDDKEGHESEHVEDTANRPATEGSSSATPSINHPVAEAAEPEPVSAPEIRMEVQDSPGGILPKELETRSVEITSTAGHTETTS